MSDDLNVKALQAQVEEDAIAVRVELTNESDRTVHAYRQSRRLLYDDATRTLRVGLTDRHADTSSGASTFVLPEFTAVDPHGTTTIELRLPRVLTRIAGANEQGAPIIERFRIDEADDVEVEVGWSDTPFYRDTRPKLAEDAHPAAQLRRWERGLATARAPLAQGPSAG
jgi:hypothetical protein